MARWVPGTAGSSSNFAPSFTAEPSQAARFAGAPRSYFSTKVQEEEPQWFATAPPFPPARHGPCDRDSVNTNPSAILAISFLFEVWMVWHQALVTARLPQATAVVMKPGEANSPMLFTFVLTLAASPPHIQTCNPGVVMLHESTDAAYAAAQRRPDGTVPHVPWPYSMITTSGGPLPLSIVYIPSVDQAAAATADAIVSNDWSSRRYISLPHVGACLHARRDLLHPPLVHRRPWAGHGQKMH